MSDEALRRKAVEFMDAVRLVSEQRNELLAACQRLLSAFRQGVPALTQHGAASQAFAASADQTTAALTELKEIVARLEKE